MTLSHSLLIPALLATCAVAQKTPATKTVDMCSPPPGSVAPELPAKILSGQGTVHFPITT